MVTKKMESHEVMITKNGKPLFAVMIDSGRNPSYVYVDKGEIQFTSSWLDSITAFELGNYSHRIAKEMFTVGLQAAVKIRVMELAQLQSILQDLDLSDCLGSVIKDNTPLLEEINRRVEFVESNTITAETVKQAITDTVQPIVLKKGKRTTQVGAEK